jgi:hypothetical protein
VHRMHDNDQSMGEADAVVCTLTNIEATDFRPQTYRIFGQAVMSFRRNALAGAPNRTLSAPTYSWERNDSVIVLDRDDSKHSPLQGQQSYVYSYWRSPKTSGNPAFATADVAVGAAHYQSTSRSEHGLACGLACRFERLTHESAYRTALTDEASDYFAAGQNPVALSIHPRRSYSE